MNIENVNAEIQKISKLMDNLNSWGRVDSGKYENYSLYDLKEEFTRLRMLSYQLKKSTK